MGKFGRQVFIAPDEIVVKRAEYESLKKAAAPRKPAASRKPKES